MSLLPTVGALKLAELDTIEATAEKLCASTRAVTKWRSGKAVPNAGSRLTIQRVYGIEPRDFDRAALAPGATPAAPPHDTADTSSEGAEARLRALMARLRLMRGEPGLTERARIEIERLELQASARLARLEGATLTTRQIVNSALWNALMGVIVDTLAPHPLALFAVERAVAQHGGDSPGDHEQRIDDEFPELVAAVRAADAALDAALTARRKRIEAAKRAA